MENTEFPLMIRRCHWQTFDSAPRFVQVNEKHLNHVPLGHIVTVALAFLLMRRIAFQSMLVAAIDRRIDRIGQLDERRRKYANQLGFQKRVKGNRVPLRLFAVPIDVAHFH